VRFSAACFMWLHADEQDYLNITSYRHIRGQKIYQLTINYSLEIKCMKG